VYSMGFIYEGVNSADGNAGLSADQDIYLGTANPILLLGFNNNMSYKDFDIKFFSRPFRNDVSQRAPLAYHRRDGRIQFEHLPN